LAFAVLSVVAWTTGYLRLASLRAEYIPMAPSTAVAFLLVSAALIALTRGGGAGIREGVRAAGLLVFTLAVIKLVEFASGVVIVNVEAALVERPGHLGAVPLARMSPLTAGGLSLTSLALICLSGVPAVVVRDVGGILGALVSLAGVIVVVGYAYGAPLLYGGSVIPMAATTGAAFVGTGLALSFLAGPSALPVRAVSRNAAVAHAAETRHRAQQYRSEYALAAAGAGVWEVDLRTGRTAWSDVVGPMFGLPAKAMQTTVDEFRARVHPDDRPSVEAAIAHAIETDAPYRVHFRAVWADGSLRWIAAKGHVLRNAAGEAKTLLGIALDVSERKELEQQLAHAQKLESLGLLAGSIAHDFNNVLTVIVGFTHLLLSDLPAGDPRETDLNEIQKAGTSGQQLTQQLLAFSRQQTLTSVRLDLGGVIATTEGILRQAVGKAVELETVLAPSLGAVWADAGQIQQTLINLAVNARDAMPNGGRLRIETSLAATLPARGPQPHATPGPHVVVAVSDTGTGMTPETMARMFEPFYTTKAAGKGTGLGLATVYGIVQQSGGAIEVTSDIGHGTTFRLYFPRLAEEPVSEQS
jgi:PAS domain S-box-containing protein